MTGAENGGRDRRSVFNLEIVSVYGDVDQSTSILRDGE
jgi:hypothetical protein